MANPEFSNAVAIILARSGSKGIPSKNIINFCGKPLIQWSVEQALAVDCIDSVWVSSDGDDILDVAANSGANVIKRPAAISGDKASSESAWLHALEHIESIENRVNNIVGMQPTSPIRHSHDIKNALVQFHEENLDSLFSAVEIEDFFMWEVNNGQFESVNYDYLTRKRRQDIQKKYLENGSFYIFKSQSLKLSGNRLSGRIGSYLMPKYKMFQIDNLEDVKLCESIMRDFIL